MSRETRKQRGLTFTLGDEAGEFAGVMVAGVDGRTGKWMPPLPQVHFKNTETGMFEAVLLENITNLNLSQRKLSATEMKLFAQTDEAYDALVSALKSIDIDFVLRHEIETPACIRDAETGRATIPVEIDGAIDTIHKRALAKVLCNFAAYYLGADEFQKSAWNKVTRFVRYDEDAILARVSNDPFWEHETASRRLPSDSYNLRIKNHPRGLVGTIQFFNLLTYQLVLALDYAIPKDREVAYRFTPGKEPIPGHKMPKRSAESR